MKNIIEMFERIAGRYPQKTAFCDENEALTYGELSQRAQAIATCITTHCAGSSQPVLIALPKSVKTIAALLGTAWSGNFYAILDMDMPEERMKKIIDNLNPAVIIAESQAAVPYAGNRAVLIDYKTASEYSVSRPVLDARMNQLVETDPLYILYTSGSTGIPKGVVVSHRNVLAYSRWVTETFTITEETIFGNQTPFYFSMSVLDIFATLRSGATLHILPKKLFSFPLRLLEYMKERHVNTIYWVPSALSIVANTRTLDYIELPELKKVLFAGEVMMVRQLNIWREHMPDLLYANLYGPTETTDICSYYVVDRDFEDSDSLPIGYPCSNCDLMVLDEAGKRVTDDSMGELYVRGPFVALGYYGQPDKTKEAFVQNPENPFYPEALYKTGDLVRYGDKGELLYCGRKDFQIKRMGYRIELGEIEAAGSSVEGIEQCVCIFHEDELHMIYQAKVTPEQLREEMKRKVPHYMQPGNYIRVKKMKFNSNGKIDRSWYAGNYKELM